MKYSLVDQGNPHMLVLFFTCRLIWVSTETNDFITSDINFIGIFGSENN